jgi:hypothetical protein
MKRHAVILSAFFVLAFPEVNFAQAPLAASPTVNFTLEQTHTIKELVKETNVPRLPVADYKIGDVAPWNIALQTFPSLVAEKVPGTQSHKFFMSGDKIVVVDPKDNKIAEIIQ